MGLGDALEFKEGESPASETTPNPPAPTASAPEAGKTAEPHSPPAPAAQPTAASALPDISAVIEKGTTRTTIEELSKKGVKRVKVINEATIRRLIAEAVETVVDRRSKALAEEEKRKIVEESRQELKRLMAEYQATKEQRDGLAQAKTRLEDDLQGLREELEKQQAEVSESVTASGLREVMGTFESRIANLLTSTSPLDAGAGPGGLQSQIGTLVSALERAEGTLTRISEWGSKIGAGLAHAAPARRARERQMAQALQKTRNEVLEEIFKANLELQVFRTEMKLQEVEAE